MIRLEHHPNGTRVHIKGWRIHHGAFGCLCVGFGIALIVSDWHDRTLWMAGR